MSRDGYEGSEVENPGLQPGCQQLNFPAMTRYEAYIKKDWPDNGLAYVVAARLRDNGMVELAALMVDCWCLGVKDAVFVEDYTEGEFREALKEHLPDDLRQPIHPAYAKKLIEGAAAYAKQFGFAPHRDYKKARRVFNGVDAAACTETFTYGKDGKPCFVSNEDDPPERINRVLAMLEARCGADGYDYIGNTDEGELSELEEDALDLREDLMDWLEAEPETVPRFFEVSGMITAMQLCPQVLMPTKLLDVLWGPGGRQWESQDEAREFMTLAMDYWNLISGIIQDSISPDAPPGETCIDVFESDFEEKDGPGFLLALREWTAGFVRVTELWPEAWGDTLVRSDLAPHWELLRCMAALENAENAARIDEMAREAPPRVLGPSVMAITRALRPPRR